MLDKFDESIIYHSAIKRNGGVAKTENVHITDVVSDGHITVLQHDVCDPVIPEVFYKADVVMVQPSWRVGYKLFTENTIATGTTFEQYCHGIDRIIRALGKPAFVLTNKTFFQLIQADRYIPIWFDRYKCEDMCGIWNYDGNDVPYKASDIMKWVGKFGTVLDFSCGYGELSYYVDKCILSDINTGCLEYIKKELMK